MKIENMHTPEVQEAVKVQGADRLMENRRDHAAHKERLENAEPLKTAEAPQQETETKQKDPHKEHGDRLEAESKNNPENLQKPEVTEVSRFSAEYYKAENTFDAHAKEHYPELNNLKSKCVYDVPPMGTDMKDVNRNPKDTYTQTERDYIKDARDKIDAPTTETVMQKVIGVDTGNLKEDLKAYFEPKTFDGKACEAHVTGCVAKANDAVLFTKTPKDCFENLRLDYDPGPGRENPYKSPEQPVYVVRFTDGTNYDIPYSKEFDKDAAKSLDAPMTGNGLTGSKNRVIPEYDVRPENKKGAIVTDGEIYRINPDGTEDPVAYYNKKHKCFKIYE